MKVFVAVKFKPFGAEELVGIGKSEKSAMKILKREFPYMREKSMSSDKDNTYLLAIKSVEVEE